MRFERLHGESLFSIVFLLRALCSNANLILDDFNFQIIERFKNDLFLTKKGIELSAQNDEECLAELSGIGSGLLNSEMWAKRIVDAWGRTPSAFLDGNRYEFGGFTECLNIERNDERYESKYCLGAMSLDIERNGTKVLQPLINVNLDVFPNIWLPNDRPDVPPEFKFGMCVPAVCSLDFLQKLIKFADRIELSESTCQTLKMGSELTNLDIAVIILLAVIFVLTILSTTYDFYCTLYSYERSRALLAFSILSNGKKILTYKESEPPGTMNCLNGIRVISAQWCIAVHTCELYAMMPSRNTFAIYKSLPKLSNLFVLCGALAVDTFFVLSGLLVSINTLKHIKKTNGSLNISSMFFHRYLRLTPLLIATVLFSMTLMQFLGSGPLWPMFMNSMKNQCGTFWWSTFLYVQNYVNPGKFCLIHTWSLSVDMQLFLVAPFIIYLMYRFDLKAIFSLSLLILGCIGLTVAVNVHYAFKGFLSPNKLQNAIFSTHLRFPSWLLGVIAGYIFMKYQNRPIRIPRTLNLFGWALSLASMLAVISANYPLSQLDSTATPFTYGLYDALSRVFWSISLCYIIFACMHNAGGPVNWFLSHPLWQPFSRISYATYLGHYLVIILVVFSSKTSLYLDELMIFHTYIGISVLSLCVAFIATLLIESPITILEKIFSSSKKMPNSELVSKGVYNETTPENQLSHSHVD